MEVGLRVLLQLVDNGVINNLEFNFFCLLLFLNFKPYFVMQSDVMCGETHKSSILESLPVISVLISNYPLANGGYLVSFGQDLPDGSFESWDPVSSLNFEASKLSKFLECSPMLLPKGCFYLKDVFLADFIRSLASGASLFDMTLLPGSPQMHGLLLVKVDRGSFLRDE